jgi:integrase
MTKNMVQPAARPVPAELRHVRHGKLAAATSLTPVTDGGGIGAGRFRLKERPNGVYAVFDGGNYVVTTKTRNLDEAQDVIELHRMQAEAKREGQLDVRHAQAAEVMDEFVAVQGRPSGTQRSIVDAMDRLRPFVDDKLVRQLNGKWLKATMEALKSAPQKPRKHAKRQTQIGYAEASRVISMRWLSVAILDWCDQNGALTYLPFKRPGQPKGRTVVFDSREQKVIQRWSRGTEDYDPKAGTWSPARKPLDARELHGRRMVERMFVIGVATASRPGAAWGLARGPSLDCPYLHEETLFRLPVGAPAPRNKLAPAVQLSPETTMHVRRWDGEDGPSQGYILHTFRGGRPLSAAACARRWAKAMKRLGIKGRRHTCRHTAVTALVSLNVPAIVISAVAGMSLQTIRRDYNHNDDRSLQPLAFAAVDTVLTKGIGIVSSRRGA